jgi:recombination associated protein RdgC
MWFKNLQIYRLPTPWAMSAELLEQLLQVQAFSACSSLDIVSQGWVPPRPDGGLVHTVNRQFLLSLGTEKKLLPASVINQVAKAKAAEIEEEQGFKPGRKQMKDIKEQVTDELLPRALSIRSTTAVWIDPVNGWLVVDASSSGKAEDVIKLLIKAVDRFPIDTLRVKLSPTAAMTEWLDHDEAPGGFTIDRDTELRATGEGKATVRYVNHTLELKDVQNHIQSGKQCTRLAMTWADKVSFVLTENLSIKRVTALDVIKEASASNVLDEQERFDGDMTMMTGELARMIADLVEALGGEQAKAGA